MVENPNIHGVRVIEALDCLFTTNMMQSTKYMSVETARGRKNETNLSHRATIS